MMLCSIETIDSLSLQKLNSHKEAKGLNHNTQYINKFLENSCNSQSYTKILVI